MKKIVFCLFALSIIFFKQSMVVKADAYCDFKTKKECTDSKNWDGDLRCQWLKVNGKETCLVKCSNYSKNSCDAWNGACKWTAVGSSYKCVNTVSGATKEDTSVPKSQDCYQIKSSSECGQNGKSCWWNPSKKFCGHKCSYYTTSSACNNSKEDCEWSKSNNHCDSASDEYEKETYSNYEDGTVSCGATDKNGEALITDIPSGIPKLTHIIYLAVLIAVPVVLVVLGMIDLFKGITSQTEDEMKKGQKTFVKRLISAFLIFFALSIVKLFIDFMADSNKSGIIKCVECFIEDKC